MKHAILIAVFLATCTFANMGSEYGDYYYWDDGVMVSGWAWYTGGNYWAVQFEQTEMAWVSWIGAMTYPDWPDETYQGCYVHAFDDLGGYPGTNLFQEYLPLTGSDDFDWIAITGSSDLTTDVFYIAFEQYGNYPSTDAMGVDAEPGTHNWTGYNGSWGQTTQFGDFMLRCCTGDVNPEDGPGPGVVATSWGEIKAAYSELEASIRGRSVPASPTTHNAWRAIKNLY